MDFDGDGTASVAASVAAAAAAARAARGGAGGAGNPTRAALLAEARNAAALKNFRPVLEGGENIELEAGTGFGGAMPEAQRGGGGGGGGAPRTGARATAEDGAGTPLTSLRGGSMRGGGSVRGGGGGGGSEAGGAPSLLAAAAAAAAAAGGGRDVLGLNAAGEEASSFGGGDARSAAFGGAGSVAFSDRRSVAPSAVALALASLPAPRHSWEAVAAPPGGAAGGGGEEEEEGGGGGGGAPGWAGSSAMVEDASEAAARRAAAEEAERAAAAARRSSVLKHTPPLPRPLVIDGDAVAPRVGAGGGGGGGGGGPPELRFAEGLIADEVLALLKRDAATYPVRWSPPPSFARARAQPLFPMTLTALPPIHTQPTPLQVPHPAFKAPRSAPQQTAFSDAELAGARALLEDAAAAAQWAVESRQGQALDAASLAAAAEAAGARVYAPSAAALVAACDATPSQRLEAAKAAYGALAAAWAREAPRLEKLAARNATLLKGYEAKRGALGKELEALGAQAADARIEGAVFRALAGAEAAEAPRRLAAAAALLEDAAAKERALQGRFAARMRGGQ
jgi:hypothetical protein